MTLETRSSVKLDLASYLASRKDEVEAALARVLPSEEDSAGDLARAMRYSTLAGGKRLRPVLALAAAETCGAGEAPPRNELAEAASSLELIHTYSLIHDDLPCMDDDSLRRGKPTCHVVFGEATALLAGDTLQSLGLEILATRPRGDAYAPRRADAVAIVASAIGLSGMAGGQALDLAATGAGSAPEGQANRLREIHAKKTGRLLSVSLELGALLAGADRTRREAVARFGDALGLVFQIADDLLDVTASSATLGKTAGKDAAQAKLTYPAVFGLEGARRELEKALDDARARAEALGDRSGLLAALAEYAGRRDK